MRKARETRWNDIKAELAQLDRAGLRGLLKDLHAPRPENRAFLAARFGVGSDPLAPFQKEISCCGAMVEPMVPLAATYRDFA